MPSRRTLGQHGEHCARTFLERKGFRFCAKNVRTPYGEIDLVMDDGEERVFIEVKYRSSYAFGTPEESITPHKATHLANAIAYCVQSTPWHGPYRLDVVAIMRDNGSRRIQHFRAVLFDFPQNEA